MGVGLPEGDTQAKGSVSLREDEHTHTDIQTPPSLPTPDDVCWVTRCSAEVIEHS